jgi:hypothetical protein
MVRCYVRRATQLGDWPRVDAMAADAFIHCRVTSEVKALVRRLAERDGINESTLVKQLLEFLLRTQALAELPAPAERIKVNRGSAKSALAPGNPIQRQATMLRLPPWIGSEK